MNFDWYWLYFFIGIVLCIIEIFTLSFYLLPIGIASILTGILALFFESLYVHVFVFVIFSIVMLYFISKWKKSRFLKPVNSSFVAGLEGQQGIVIKLFKSVIEPGKVKIFSDEWDIYCDSHNEQLLKTLVEGDIVKVISVKGNKIKVEKVTK